ncbi:DUF2007 domain-containing protein [candidate division WOR-3 bacterium]|nr:DUF2007 domain-containing protein [candidate division WOR-3 bacterium]
MDGKKNKELITIGRFNRLMDAYLIASRIESEGIECFLPDESLARSLHNHFIGSSEVRLQVRREDATRALRILNKEPFDSFDNVLSGSDPEI